MRIKRLAMSAWASTEAIAGDTPATSAIELVTVLAKTGAVIELVLEFIRIDRLSEGFDSILRFPWGYFTTEISVGAARSGIFKKIIQSDFD